MVNLKNIHEKLFKKDRFKISLFEKKHDFTEVPITIIIKKNKYYYQHNYINYGYLQEISQID